MARRKTTAATKELASVKDSLARVAKKLAESSSTKQGQIVLNLSGSGGAHYCLDCAPGKTTVSEGAAGLTQGAPLIEVTGDASVVRSILAGKKDALKQFAAGGLRIRGDLRYFSDLALELGIIDTPL